MQLYPILIVAVVVGADVGLGGDLADGRMTPGVAALVAVLPVAFIVAAARISVIACCRRLSLRPSPGPIKAAARVADAGRLMILAHFVLVVLGLGWLDAVRAFTGDPVLVDEVICLLPPVLGQLGLWWAYYPMERRLRESLLIRQLDEGVTIHPIPTPRRYVAFQASVGLWLLLIPLLIIIAVAEAVDVAATHWSIGLWPAEGGKLLAVLVVVMLWPLAVKLILDVRPLTSGDVRDDLTEICRRHGVRVRDVLLWNTGGTVVNAAIMGFFGPLRYVLLTDSLVGSLSRRQTKAVLAHELAHVRHRHFPWLLVALVGAISAAFLVMAAVLSVTGLASSATLDTPGGGGIITIAVIAQLSIAFLAFGWVSRRFELQADAFGAQHLSGMGLTTPAGRQEPVVVSEDAVHSMQGMLLRVARLGSIDPAGRDWRHGSVRWREARLQTLIGRPADRLPIDRSVRLIKLLSLATLALGIAGQLLL